MTPGQVFLLAIFCLYLTDCFFLVPRRGVAFLSVFRRTRWRTARPSEGLGNDRSGLVMAMPLPTLGRAFPAGLWPISFTAEGFTGVVSSCPNPGSRPSLLTPFFRWKDLKEIGWDGRHLLINGERYLKLASPQIAQEFAALIHKFGKLPAAERPAAIARWCDFQLSAKRTRRRLRIFERATAGLRHSCNLLFLLTFIAVPLFYWYFGATLRFFVILGAMVFLMVMIGIEFWCIHRKLYPKQRGERAQLWMLVGFMPQFAIRAVDELSKGFFTNVHPLAPAEVVLDDTRFRNFRDTVLRDVQHPVPFRVIADGLEDSLRAAKEFRDTFERPALEKIAHRRLGKTDQVEPVLKPLDEGCTRYCPRCLTPYGEPADECEDCGGVSTQRLTTIAADAS